MGVSVYVCVRESVCVCICMCVWRKLCEGKKGGRRLTTLNTRIVSLMCERA